jgi:hypothetical protein
MLFALIGNVLVVRDGDGMESGYCVGDLTSLMRVAATPRALYGRAAVISGPRQVDRATLHHAALRLAVHRLDKDRKP